MEKLPCKGSWYPCHYRRYLLNEQEKLFTEAQILSLLQQYDVITTKELQLNFLIMRDLLLITRFYIWTKQPVDTGDLSDMLADFQQLDAAKAHLFRKYADCKKRSL